MLVFRRRVPPSPRKVYPCLCGFKPQSYNAHIQHRQACEQWKNRPDPRGLFIARWKHSYREGNPRKLCYLCHKPPARHDPSCLLSPSEAARLALTKKHGLTMDQVFVLMAALKAMYPNGL